MDDAKVNDQSLPAIVLDELKKQNLAKDAYKDAKTAEALSRIESIVIEGNKVIVTPRAP
jgi:hypothetical protein